MSIGYARKAKKRRERPAIAALDAPNEDAAFVVAGFEDGEGVVVGFNVEPVAFDGFVTAVDIVAAVAFEEVTGLTTLVMAGRGGSEPPVLVSRLVGIGLTGTMVEAVEIAIGLPEAEGVDP